MNAILVSVISSVSGALAAYTFNFFHWRMVNKNQSMIESGKVLLNYIEKIETTSMKYWSTDSLTDDTQRVKSEKKINEIELKSLLKLTNSLINDFTSISHDKLLASEAFKLHSFLEKCFDLITGDEFETIDKKADFNKCAKLANEFNLIKVIILKKTY